MGWVRGACLLAAAAAFAWGLVTALAPEGGVRHPQDDQSGGWRAGGERREPRNCPYEFVKYSPSAWEERWTANIESWQGPDGPHDGTDHWLRGCAEMKKDESLVNAFEAGMKLWKGAPRADLGAPFSRFTYRNACSGEVRDVPIEPLVSFLRHPRAICLEPYKTPKDRSTACIVGGYKCLTFSKEFLLLPWNQSLSPSRALFFDIGASLYDSGAGGASQKWFVETYASRGIRFDRILAWEATAHPPQKVWNSFPPELRPRVTYYNVPVRAERDSGYNPFEYLRQLSTEQDYVVVKLDIDQPQLEEALVAYLVADPSLMRLVDEFIWEHHVRRHPMSWPGGWGRDNLMASTQTTSDSYRHFTKLRRHGVRAHSWV